MSAIISEKIMGIGILIMLAVKKFMKLNEKLYIELVSEIISVILWKIVLVLRVMMNGCSFV